MQAKLTVAKLHGVTTNLPPETEVIRQQYLGMEQADGVITARITALGVNRDGSIVDPLGMDATNYLSNPQILWNHNSDYPIGTALSLTPDTVSVTTQCRLHGETEKSQEIQRLVDIDAVRALSIAFAPTDMITRGQRDWNAVLRQYADRLNTTSAELERQGCNVIYRKWELLEFSLVAVGANPKALVTAHGLVSTETYKQVKDGCRVQLAEIKMITPPVTKIEHKTYAPTVTTVETHEIRPPIVLVQSAAEREAERLARLRWEF